MKYDKLRVELEGLRERNIERALKRDELQRSHLARKKAGLARKYERSAHSPTLPSTDERVSILAKLLKLAAAGKCGPVYCTGVNLQIGLDIYGAVRAMSWTEARALADTWVETKIVKRGPQRAARMTQLRKRA